MTNTNLLVINNDKVSSPIGEEYNNNGGNLTQRFYKSSNEYQYNFIVFNKTVEEVKSKPKKKIDLDATCEYVFAFNQQKKKWGKDVFKEKT